MAEKTYKCKNCKTILELELEDERIYRCPSCHSRYKIKSPVQEEDIDSAPEENISKREGKSKTPKTADVSDTEQNPALVKEPQEEMPGKRAKTLTYILATVACIALVAAAMYSIGNYIERCIEGVISEVKDEMQLKETSETDILRQQLESYESQIKGIEDKISQLDDMNKTQDEHQSEIEDLKKQLDELKKQLEELQPEADGEPELGQTKGSSIQKS